MTSTTICIWYSAGPKEDSLYEWVGSIKGPQGSVYEGGTFLLDIKFSPDYPFKPPKASTCTIQVNIQPVHINWVVNYTIHVIQIVKYLHNWVINMYIRVYKCIILCIYSVQRV